MVLPANLTARQTPDGHRWGQEIGGFVLRGALDSDTHADLGQKAGVTQSLFFDSSGTWLAVLLKRCSGSVSNPAAMPPRRVPFQGPGWGLVRLV